jgi:hypothetical protein
MSEALISHLDRDEARVLAPTEVPLCAPVSTGSIHRELKKVAFMVQPPRHGWRTW